MLDAAERLCLGDDPIAPRQGLLRSGLQRRGQEEHLDRDLAEPLSLEELVREPDRREAPLAELPDQAVRPEAPRLRRPIEERRLAAEEGVFGHPAHAKVTLLVAGERA